MHHIVLGKLPEYILALDYKTAKNGIPNKANKHLCKPYSM